MVLVWSNRPQPDEEDLQPPPKYSSCVSGVYSKQNINYLPTYEEALRNIQMKKQYGSLLSKSYLLCKILRKSEREDGNRTRR